MSFLDLFRPAPHVQEMQDEKLVEKSYKYWRIRIFYGMYIGYVFYYFSRKSLTFAMPSLMHDLGLEKTDIGILATLMAVTYGLSKFLSGVLSDRANPRYFMAIGLIVTGATNIFFGMASSVFMFAFLWGLNGWFQGWGWPPCARLLTHWYSQKERGTWWGVWNSSHSAGLAIIAILGPILSMYYGWRAAMYAPGVLCMGMGFFLINRLRDTPQSLGLPSIEKFRNDYHAASRLEENQKESSSREILVQYVLRNRCIWLLGLAYLFVYFIRQGMNDWGMLYLTEVRGHASLFAGSCIVSFEIGGLCGSLVAGWASDKIFGGKRGPINVLFSLAVVIGLASLWLAPQNSGWLDSTLMFVIGFLIYGPQMLIGMAAAELSHKKAAGSATGFIGWLAYLGAACAGYPLSVMMQSWGWEAFFIALGISGGISVLLLLPLWSAKVNPKYLVIQDRTNQEEPAQA